MNFQSDIFLKQEWSICPARVLLMSGVRQFLEHPIRISKYESQKASSPASNWIEMKILWGGKVLWLKGSNKTGTMNRARQGRLFLFAFLGWTGEAPHKQNCIKMFPLLYFCNFVNLSAFKLDIYSFCQLFIMSAFHLTTFSSCQLFILPAFHLENFLSCQLFILSAFHFVSFSSCQLFILSAFHLVRFSSCQLFILSAFHLVSFSSCQLVLWRASPFSNVFKLFALVAFWVYYNFLQALEILGGPWKRLCSIYLTVYLLPDQWWRQEAVKRGFRRRPLSLFLPWILYWEFFPQNSSTTYIHMFVSPSVCHKCDIP